MHWRHQKEEPNPILHLYFMQGQVSTCIWGQGSPVLVRNSILRMQDQSEHGCICWSLPCVYAVIYDRSVQPSHVYK